MIFLSYYLLYPGRLPLQAAASSFEIGLKMTEGFYIIKDRNVRSGEGEREDVYKRQILDTGRTERCPFQHYRTLLSGVCAERPAQQQSRSQGTGYDLSLIHI